MIDPAPGGTIQSSEPSGSSSASASPSLTPAIVSSAREPKFACTKAPTVNVSGPHATCREAVPLPALKPQQFMPVPPPTEPSSIGPEAAESSAA